MKAFRTFARIFYFTAIALGALIVLMNLMPTAHAQSDGTRAVGVNPEGQRVNNGGAEPTTAEEALARYTTDLTAAAKDVRFVGDRDWLRRIAETIEKVGNKVLYVIGEAGSGKSAMVEASAGLLEGRKMYRLEVNALVEGTKHHGDFERRLEALLKNFIGHPENILFIDEIHVVLEKHPEVLQRIKPEMARGQIVVVAATTAEEYKKYVEFDTALTSRGNRMDVPNPTEEKVYTILQSEKPSMQKHHGLNITDSALKLLSHFVPRYYSGEPTIRKALDIIDRTASRMKLIRKYGTYDSLFLKNRQQALRLQIQSLESDLAIPSQKANTESIEIKIGNLKDDLAAVETELGIENEKLKITEYRAEIQRFTKEAADKQRAGKLAEAAEITNQKIPFLQHKIQNAGLAGAISDSIADKEVADFLASETKTPADFFLRGSGEVFSNLERDLNKRAIGQDHAAREIVRELKIRAANVEPARGPRAVIVADGTRELVGEIAKTIAEGIYGRTDKLHRIDLGQLSDMSSSRLIGSAPGLIGSVEGGQLDVVRRDKFSVLLLENYDKTQDSIRSILIQGLTQGEMPDGLGRAIDLRNTIIVLQTSSAGHFNEMLDEHLTETERADRAIEMMLEGRGVPQELIDASIKVSLKPLTFEQTVRYAQRLLNEQRAFLKERYNVTVEFKPNVADALARLGYDGRGGVAGILKARRQMITELMAELQPQFKDRSTVIVDFHYEGQGESGKLVSQVDGQSTVDPKTVVFKAATSSKAKTADFQGEAGRAKDPRSVEALADRAVERAKGKK